MELAHSLLLNEEALARIAENKRPVFIYEWLRFLDKVLVAAQKSDIKGSQQKLVQQLTVRITENPGPPTRKLLARCLATLFSVGDTFSLFDTINKCNDIIRNKDDSPSYLPTRLAAIACIGGMYEKLGRMVGRSYEETVGLLIKSLKNAESQGRYEIMTTLQKVVAGLGSVGSVCFKDIYKSVRNCMTDRSMSVRCAAAKCLLELVHEAPFTHTTEVDNISSLCLRALDGSNYDVRCEVAKLLGELLAATQTVKGPQQVSAKVKQLKVADVLNIMASGFVRGGSGFLKQSGEMIKGTGQINREVRVGVTHAYVAFVKCMGGLWLERNISEFLNHVLNLVANPKATPTHVDAVYARKCVLFILRYVVGSMLGEKAQIAAAKEICQIIIKQMNSAEAAAEASNDKNQSIELAASQHVLVCALHELGHLVQTLGTSASPLVAEPQAGIIEPVVSVLIHPCPAARLSAAWCLRSIAVALPFQLTPLIDRCIDRVHQLRSSPEAVSGYSYAMAALLGGVYQCSLGIPHAKGKQIFNIAEELLRSATQNSRLSLQRTQSGWLLLGAVMTLGAPVVKTHLPRMLLLWRNAFPRSTKELESEKARGDAFTWQITLEGRAGALGAMHSFISCCPELVTEDVTRRLLPPLECALTMLAHIPSVIKMYGAHLKASAAMVRLRLYDVLALLPPETYEGAYNSLLRELVAEFTLTDNPANTTTSLLRFLCHVDDSVILGSWLQETDHKAIEDQLEPNRKLDTEHLQPNSASGSGALEHDSATVYMRLQAGESIPGPLPLGVAVIDSSVRLFGLVFPGVPHKHRLQMLEHFSECIKQAKSTRQQAVQMNIFTAVLSALKGLADTKTGFGQLEVRKAAINLVLGASGNVNPILRCAAGEALGRMTQVIGDAKFIAEMAQYSFDRLKSARDVVTRTGLSLALGCLHRYVGGMGSGHHLNTSVSILLALAQDTTSPVVQVWALHALALIADSGGPMFRGYVEPTLSLVLQLLLSVPPSNVDVHQCLGKCLAALITTIGPELQGNSGSIATARLSCLVCCAIMQEHTDSMVQAEAISCLQQLHMFAPRHVNLSTLVPHLCATLSSNHLLLRRAAVACLRQLTQREAREVCEYAMTLAVDSKEVIKDSAFHDSFNITETGLEGAMFSLLDTETDSKLCSDVHDTLISMLQTLAADNLKRWLILIKDVLQASTDASSTLQSPTEETAEGDKEEEDEDVAATMRTGQAEITHPTVAPRWPTRVFAVQCLLKIMSACEGTTAHFDLALAKDIKTADGKDDYLVLHLSELVRMAFIAATSDSDKLRLAGLAALQDIIQRFSKVPEPEFPGHVILEQYQAQVGAALRPAFAPDTPSDVTAAACDVCSTWIGSGVARDLNDLRRVHQLLVSSLKKMKAGKGKSQIYSESASTMEKLAVLKAWAEVYIVAMMQEQQKIRDKALRPKNQDEDEYGGGESLLNLVRPELASLSQNWLAALKDHAMLSLPAEYSSQLPPEGGTFYTSDTMESAKPHFKKSWPPVLYATSLWLNETGFAGIGTEKAESSSLGGTKPLPSLSAAANAPANMKPEQINADRLHLMLGISIEALCSPTSVQPVETVTLCLRAIHTLMSSAWPRHKLAEDPSLGIELLNVLHRLLLTRDSSSVHLLVMNVAKQVIVSAQEKLEQEKSKANPETEKPAANAEGSPATVDEADSSCSLGEGGESGDIIPGKSQVFAVLEVCLCVLVRHLPALNPALPSTGFQQPSLGRAMCDEACELVADAVQIMGDLVDLCSPQGTVSILPTVLFLVTGVIREMGTKCEEDSSVPAPVTKALHVLKTICTARFVKETSPVSKEWIQLLRSALATVIGFTKPKADEEKTEIDECVLMLTITVFLVSAPQGVVCVSNLQKPCVEVFTNAWAMPDPKVRLKCIQALTSIYQRQNLVVATSFIHAMAPPVVEYLLATATSRPDNQLELQIAMEGIKMMEVLVAAAQESARLNLLAIIVPVLVAMFIETSKLPSASKPSRALHDYALQHMMKIGPLYPAEFRTIMGSSVDLRTRLEAAVKANQASNSSKQAARPINIKPAQPIKPSITLKTDFSNFTG